MNATRRNTLVGVGWAMLAAAGVVGCAGGDGGNWENLGETHGDLSVSPTLGVDSFCEMWWMGPDRDKAKAFYSKQFVTWTFGAPFDWAGRVYTPWVDGTGPGGKLTNVKLGEANAWRPFVRVADIQASVAVATKQGGSVVVPITAFTQSGDFYAVVKDPTGAQVGLWYSPAAPTETGEELGIDSFYRMRLITPDPDKAKSFYRAVFPSWTWHAPVTIGGRVFVPWDDGSGPGGEVVRPVSGETVGWHSFVRVTTLESALSTATRNGARVVTPPTNHGTYGRYAVVADPGNVAIGFWQK